MFPQFRRSLFSVFAIFFIVISPFIIIYSLGYDLNFSGRGLTNTLTISVETLPRGADIKNNTVKVGQSPTELQAADGELVDIAVETQDFATEKFLVYGQKDSNSTARIKNLTLLPTSSNQLAEFESQPLAILANSTILFKEGDRLFIQLYSFGGLQGRKQEVIVNTEREPVINSWETLSNNSFWQYEDDFLLLNKNNDWILVDLKDFPSKFVSIVSLSPDQLLMLDTTGNLWLYSINTSTFSFLVNNINGLESTNSPETVWIWSVNSIYRLPKKSMEVDTLELDKFLYNKIPLFFGISLSQPSFRSFGVSSVFQGIMFKIQDTVYYVPDFNTEIWQVIANNVEDLTVDSNAVFWLDKSYNLYSYNLLLKTQSYLGSIPQLSEQKNIRLSYFFTWRRLFLYTEKEVYSVWYDKDLINESIVRYYPYKWLENSACLPQIVDRFQFCLQDKKLVSWKNTNFW